MKTSTIILLGVIAVVVADLVGRHLERMAMVQSHVVDLNHRVFTLESQEMRRKERWSWLVRIGSWIPFMSRLLNSN